jgi:hypothetical protein
MCIIMYRHLERKHKAVFEAYRSTATVKPTHDVHQPSVTAFLPKSTYGSKHPEQVKRTSSFINNVIIGCGLPLSISENEHFIQFVHCLHPEFTLPSHKHISSTLIPAAFNEKQKALKKLIDEARFVSLTVDIWTDRVMHSYLAVTCHMLIDLQPVSGLLQFVPIDGSHIGQRIAEHIHMTIDEFNLNGKS